MEEERDESLDYLMEPPADLHELYMRLRLNLSKSNSFHKIYILLLSLLDVGGQLLPNNYKDVKEEVELVLEDEDYYPQKRQVEKDGSDYRLGGDNTGLIVVRSEDISYGLREAIEQQTSALIPKLKVLDNKIFRALVEEGEIKRKQPMLEDLLIEDSIDELREKLGEMNK